MTSDTNDEASQASDVKVTVVETATGKTLSVEEAPLASQVQAWLEMNPGWEVVPREEDEVGSDDDETDEEEEGKPKKISTEEKLIPVDELNKSKGLPKPVTEIIHKAKVEDDEYRISTGEQSYYG